MHRICAISLALLLTACPKTAPKPPADPTADALREWTRTQLDLRAWRSCTRSALNIDLETAAAVFPVAADGTLGVVAVEPAASAHDPGMICLQMELAHPPASVPAPGADRTVRLPLSGVHAVPEPGG